MPVPQSYRLARANTSSGGAPVLERLRNLPALSGWWRAEKLVLNFFQQLSLLLEAHVPLLQALRVIKGQVSDRSFNRTLDRVIFEVEAGLDLSVALTRHGRYFSNLVCSLIRVGESSGRLAGLSSEVARYLTRRYRVRRILWKALSYPLIVMAVALVTAMFLFLFLLPSFAMLFRDLSMELPWITRAFMAVSTLLTSYWYILALLVIATVAMLPSLRRSPAWKWLQSRLISLPIFSTILRHSTMEYYGGTMAILLENGIPLREAVITCYSSARSQPVQRLFQRMIRDLEAGESISRSIAASPLIPEEYVQMVKAGEETAELPAVFSSIADISGERVESRLDTLGAILEPAIIIVMSVFVGAILIALYLPIFELSTGMEF